MSNLGLASRYLRLDLKQQPQGTFLHQSHLIQIYFLNVGYQITIP